MKAKRIAAALLALITAGTLLVSCGKTPAASTAATPSTSAGSTATDENSPPVSLEWLVGQTSAEIDEDSEVLKMVEERFNADLKGWYVDSNKFWENLNVKFAGGEMPDVLVLDNLSQLPALVEGGIVGELPIELVREIAPNFAKVADENDDGSFWSTMVYKGKNYGIAQPVDVVPMSMFWRKDWLDKLNLEVPTTIEEYEAVLTAFVENDPDGNSKKDTAALAERAFGSIFGAYGLRCVTGGFAGFNVEEMQLGEDNVPFFPWIRPEAKEVLTLLNRWYQKGIIDKEFITGENHGGYAWLSHSFMNGRIGLTSAQPYHYLNSSMDTQNEKNWGVCMRELKALNPDADIVIGPAPVGPDGKSGTEAWQPIGRLTVLTTKATSDPRKVETFLKMMEAYYTDMDYARLVNYGIEGTHWEETENGPIRLLEGVDLRKGGVLQFDFGNTVVFAENIIAKKTAFGHEASPLGYYRFNAPPVEEFSNVIATLDTLTEQAYFDMITGAKPLSYFETFVEEFKKNGGEEAEKAVQQAYTEKLASVK